MKISKIELFKVTGHISSEWHWAPEYTLAPLHRYPEFQRQTPGRIALSDQDRFATEAIYISIHADDGHKGMYGPIMPEQAFIIHTKLKPFLLGRDPLNTEELWDQMYRLDRHGRSGYMMMAISAVDNALWDLKGKYYNKPVNLLVHEAPRQSIKAYCTINDNPDDHNGIRQHCRFYKQQGFSHQKWYIRHGPQHQSEGAMKSKALIELLHEELDTDGALMIDGWMGLDMDYMRNFASLIDFESLMWLEEPFMPGHFHEYLELKKLVPNMQIAAGEHFYTWEEVRLYLEAGCLNFLQCDPDWCGGITEMLRIIRNALDYNVTITPHAHSIAAQLHIASVLTETICPMQEYLPRHLHRQQHFHSVQHYPVNGYYSVPTDPGLGIDIDESKVESYHVLYR